MLFSNAFVGLLLTLWDLQEMRQVASLLCEIQGQMDASNLHLIGFALSLSETKVNNYRKRSLAGSSLASDKRYAVLNYHPKPDRSFFFTFVIDLNATIMENMISMENADPIHLDQRNQKCSLLLPGLKCLTGTVLGRLILWDVASHKVLGNFYDTRQADKLPISKKTLQKPFRAQSADKPLDESAITALCLTSSETVASSSADNKIKIWDFVKMQLLHELKQNNEQVF